MNNKTIIMEPVTDKTQLLSSPKTQEQVQNLQTKAQSHYSVIKGIAAGGIALGVGAVLSSFIPAGGTSTDDELVPIYDVPNLATSVNDQMSYQEAFDAARTELGPGHYFTWHGQNFSTYTQEEWQRLDTEDQAEYEQFLADHPPVNLSVEEAHMVPVVIHDVAPEANGINDEMSFQQAFATARQEVGAGGVFHWRSQCYGTYYQKEWQSMDEDARHSFSESHAHISTPQVDTTNDNSASGDNASAVIIHKETLLGEEMGVISGQPVRIATYQDEYGEQTLRVDADLDGTYDYIYMRDSNQLVNVENNAVIDLNQLDEPEGETASVLYTQEGDIEGHPALAHMMSDGSVQILVDIDLNGSYDTHLSYNEEVGGIIAINLQGEVEVFKTTNDESISVSLEDEDGIVLIGEDDIVEEPTDVVILSEEDIMVESSQDVLLTDEQPMDDNWINTVAREEDSYESTSEFAYHDLHPEFGDDVILGDAVSDWA